MKTSQQKPAEKKILRSTGRERAGKRASAGANTDFTLLPGLRERLITEMDASKIPEGKRVRYLATLTGRAVPTTMRWLDEEKPGLPDLQSFVDLCLCFDSDANWLLGLISGQFSSPKLASHKESQEPTAVDQVWMRYIRQQESESTKECGLLAMIGDDMTPRIPNGAPMWIDQRVTAIHKNGTYLLEYQGRTLVRHVEIRIGEGLRLTCENVRFQPIVVKNAAAAKKMGLRVLGQIKLVLKAEEL